MLTVSCARTGSVRGMCVGNMCVCVCMCLCVCVCGLFLYQMTPCCNNGVVLVLTVVLGVGGGV